MKIKNISLTRFRSFWIGLFIVCGLAYHFHSPVHIKYDIYDQSLRVEMTTARLYTRSVQESDRPFFNQLFSDPKVMDTLSDTTTFSAKTIDWVFKERWLTKWKKHIPFSGFAVFHKKDHAFMGFMRVEKTDQPGQLEIAYALRPQYWNQGYGTEMIQALIHYYIPYLMRLDITVQGVPITEITAHCRQDNVASKRVLEKNHFVLKEKNMNKFVFSYPIKASSL